MLDESFHLFFSVLLCVNELAPSLQSSHLKCSSFCRCVCVSVIHFFAQVSKSRQEEVLVEKRTMTGKQREAMSERRKEGRGKEA